MMYATQRPTSNNLQLNYVVKEKRNYFHREVPQLATCIVTLPSSGGDNGLLRDELKEMALEMINISMQENKMKTYIVQC